MFPSQSCQSQKLPVLGLEVVLQQYIAAQFSSCDQTEDMHYRTDDKVGPNYI